MTKRNKVTYFIGRSAPGGSDKPSVRFGLYAVRLKGDDGWTDVAIASEPDQLVDHYRKNGRDVEEIRSIQSDAGSKGSEEPEIGSWTAVESALYYGWTYDELASYWRAPEEPMTPFPSVPVRVDSIDITFGPIDPWLPVKMVASDQEVEIGFSDVFPPFEGLIEWLEHVAEGKEARYAVDIEGPDVEFFSFEHGIDNRIRIVIAYALRTPREARHRRIEFDIDIDRSKFVSAFYRAFRSYATGPLFDPKNWEIGVHLNQIRSDKIERYLDFQED